MPRRLALVLVLPVALAAAPSSAAPSSAAGPGEVLRGRAEALEGDVLSVGGTTVRLHGIDAPDPGQTCHAPGGREYDCGEVARRELSAILEGREVACELAVPPGRDGRRVGTCRSEGKSIAGAMVIRGWAFAAIRLSPDYVRVQAAAQSRKAGMWAGRVEAPWNWRSRKAAAGLP